MQAHLHRLIAVGAVVGVLGGAQAQTFVNGDFETGTLAGWSLGYTSNGTTVYQSVDQIDIDGGGPLGTNYAAGFSVGQVTFQSGVPAGIELTQSLNLVAGVRYDFDFDFAVVNNNANSGNAQGGIFSLIVDGTAWATVANGSIGAAARSYGHVTASFTPGSTGAYVVGARIARPYISPGTLLQYVDNFATTAVPEPASMIALGLGVSALVARRRRV